MITYNQLKEKCDCWTGYKSKPGTKPCAEDSCMKEEKDAGGHGSEKHHVMAFGRMNPITSGHEAVVNKVHEVAKKNNATHGLVVSHSQDAKKNPLTGEQKVQHAKNAFPGTNVSSASKDKPTILHHAAAAHAAGAQHLHVVAGSDRHEEMHKLLHKYNDQKSAHGHYNFKSITVHSSGERDPDSEGTTGISASKMREHAASGNKEAFHAGAPSKMKPEHKDAMYHDVRKGMNIKEETMDQQADHAKQLKRFKDQMTKLNGPNKETETDLDKLEKEIMSGEEEHGLMHNSDPMVDSHVRVGQIKQMTEKLDSHADASVWINDFISSTNPKFNNKTKEERRKMAIGAFMAAKAKLKEGAITPMKPRGEKPFKPSMERPKGEWDPIHGKAPRKGKLAYDIWKQKVNQDKGIKEGAYEDAEENKRSADSAKEQGDMFAHHLHMADHHDNLSQWHSEKGRHNVADSHARKSEEHHETAMSLKESRGHKIVASFLKKRGAWDTPVTCPKCGKSPCACEPSKIKEGTLQGNIGGGDAMNTTTSAPTASTAKDTTMGKTIKGFKFFKGENDKQMNMNQPVKEEAPVAPVPDRKYIKGTPENKAYKETKKPINGHPTGKYNEEVELDEDISKMSTDKLKKHWDTHKDQTGASPVFAAQLRQVAKELTKRKAFKEAKDDHEYGYEGEMALNQLATLTRCAEMIKDMLKPDTDLPEWVQSKITLATDYIQTAADYLYSESEVNEETLDERNKANALMRKTMDASRGAKFKLKNPVPDADSKHKTARDHNVAIGRALRNEAMTGNPGNGYHGSVESPDEKYKATHAHVKNLTDGDDKTVKHYMDSTHGRHLAGREDDHEYIKKDFKKFKKYYKPEMHEGKAANVDDVNAAGQEPHEEKWEPAPKKVSKLKKRKL